MRGDADGLQDLKSIHGRIACERDAHAGVIDHADINGVAGIAAERDLPFPGCRLGNLGEQETGGFQNVPVNTVVLPIRPGDAQTCGIDGGTVMLDDDVDLLRSEGRDRKGGFHLAMLRKVDPVRAAVLGPVDDRIETPESRRQIPGGGDCLHLAQGAVGEEAELLLSVSGHVVYVQENSVDHDAVCLCRLQRLPGGLFGLLAQNGGAAAGGEIGHAVGEQQDRAGQSVLLPHAVKLLRRPQHGRADVGVVAGAERLDRLHEDLLVLHAVDGLQARIIADRLVKGDHADIVALFGQKSEKEPHGVIAQPVGVGPDPVHVAKAPALIHDQNDIIAVGKGDVFLRIGCDRTQTHECKQKDRSEKGRKQFLHFFHGALSLLLQPAGPHVVTAETS